MAKDWKQILLGSGLPLEHLTRKIFHDSGFLVFVEHNYLRINEKGEPTNFSIDLRAISRSDAEEVTDLFLIECKYRSPDTYWAFIPNEYQEPFNQVPSPFETHNFMVDARLIPSFNSTNFNQRDFVWKGIEINSKDNNPQSITRAVSQVQYAFLESWIDHATSVLSSKFSDYGGKQYPYLVSNIIVTTADIRVLRPTTSIEDFEKAADLEEITEERDFVILDSLPDPYYTQYARNRIFSLLSKESLERSIAGVDFEDEEWEKVDSMLQTQLEYNVNLNPRFYFIVKYDKLTQLMNLLHEERKTVAGIPR